MNAPLLATLPVMFRGPPAPGLTLKTPLAALVNVPVTLRWLPKPPPAESRVIVPKLLKLPDERVGRRLRILCIPGALMLVLIALAVSCVVVKGTPGEFRFTVEVPGRQTPLDVTASPRGVRFHPAMRKQTATQ